MAYIGREPTVGNFQVCDAISVVNNQAAYTMQVGGVNVSPETANHMLVSLNGILQKPGSSFTVSGSTITFASNLVTGDVINFIHILGNVLDLGVPSDSTVSTAKIVDANVTSAKMFSGFANGITEADQWRITADLNSNAQPISANWERNDSTGFGKIGTGITESSGYFSFPSTGVYFINFGTTGEVNGDSLALSLYTTTDNSSYSIVAVINLGDGGNYPISSSKDFIFNVTNTTTHKCYLRASSMAGNNNTRLFGASDSNYTQITFIRLGDSV